MPNSPYMLQTSMQDATAVRLVGCDKHLKLELRYLSTRNVVKAPKIKDAIEQAEKEEKKRADNIRRTRNRIYELAMCNRWDWFVTLTIDPKKYNRTDLRKIRQHITQYIRNYNRLNGLSIKYLLIAEKHADGQSWHFHGFFAGLPVEHLEQFRLGMRMGKKLADKVKAGEVIYNWLPFMQRFGFCDLEPIKNPEAVSKYVTKYITKDLSNSVTELGEHMYFCSQQLKRAETLAVGHLDWENLGILPDFAKEYDIPGGGSVYFKTVSLPWSQELEDALMLCCTVSDREQAQIELTRALLKAKQVNRCNQSECEERKELNGKVTAQRHQIQQPVQCDKRKPLYAQSEVIQGIRPEHGVSSICQLE